MARKVIWVNAGETGTPASGLPRARPRRASPHTNSTTGGYRDFCAKRRLSTMLPAFWPGAFQPTFQRHRFIHHSIGGKKSPRQTGVVVLGQIHSPPHRFAEGSFNGRDRSPTFGFRTVVSSPQMSVSGCCMRLELIRRFLLAHVSQANELLRFPFAAFLAGIVLSLRLQKSSFIVFAPVLHGGFSAAGSFVGASHAGLDLENLAMICRTVYQSASAIGFVG